MAIPKIESIHSISTSRLNSEFREHLSLGKEDRYCRFLMHHVDRKPDWFCIGTPSSKRTTSTIAAVIGSSEGFKDDENILGGINVFFSVNQFFSWRKGQQVSQIHANYLDIDVKKEVSTGRSKQILNNVLGQLGHSNMPYPNAIVSSGSGGWHLYWMYQPVKGLIRNQNVWKQVAHKLINSVTDGDDFHVDAGASSDITRVLRLPGTFHLKAKDWCSCVHLSQLYDFNVLGQQLSVTKPLWFHKSKSTSKKASTSKHNIKEFFAKVHFQLLSIANEGKVSKAMRNRDMFLFLNFAALRHIYDADTTLMKTHELNIRYKLFKDTTKVDAYMQSAYEKSYHFTKQTLNTLIVKHFESSLDCLKPLIKLSADEVAKRRSKGAINAAKKRKLKVTERIKSAIDTLTGKSEKITYKAIADVCGLSYRTMMNRKNEIDLMLCEFKPLSI